MHEASLMQSLMAKLDALAREHRASRLKRVRVWLGALSHFSADHFREHFVESARGTAAEGAELDIELSADLADPRAQDVVVESIDVEAGV